MVFPHSQMPCPGWTWILYSNQRLCLAGWDDFVIVDKKCVNWIYCT
jgi:hypothetical protein